MALELAVSELVSNALVHGAGSIQVGLLSDGDQIRLEVTDEGRTPEPPRPAEGTDTDGAGGWGLRIVDELADRWGSVSDAERTRVWVIMEASPNHRSSMSP